MGKERHAGGDGGIGDGSARSGQSGGGGRTGGRRTAARTAAATTGRRHPEHFFICGLLGVLRTPSHGPGRPAHAAADQALINIGNWMMINSVMLADAKGGKVERRPTHDGV